MKTHTPQSFWDKVDRSFSIYQCWPWVGSCLSKGYGQICVSGVKHLTHRYSYSLLHGPIPENMKVLHHCDNPPCCNPFHLFLGNDQDNMRDCVEKRRQARGSQIWSNVLTEEEVREIRGLVGQINGTLLAYQYNVDFSTIYSIWKGKTWKWVI
jgi:hypothetical protein